MDKTIKPALSLPDKNDIETQDTAIIPAIVFNGPMTPIPPVPKTWPFFRGVMPLPPSVNHMYRVGRVRERACIIPAPELERFKRDAAILMARSSRSYVDWRVVEAVRTGRQKTPLAVKLDAYFPTEWKRDLDNVIKPAIDAAYEFLSLNDNLNLDIHARKFVDAEDPRIEIEVRCLTR